MSRRRRLSAGQCTLLDEPAPKPKRLKGSLRSRAAAILGADRLAQLEAEDYKAKAFKMPTHGELTDLEVVRHGDPSEWRVPPCPVSLEEVEQLRDAGVMVICQYVEKTLWGENGPALREMMNAEDEPAPEAPPLVDLLGAPDGAPDPDYEHGVPKLPTRAFMKEPDTIVDDGVEWWRRPPATQGVYQFVIMIRGDQSTEPTWPENRKDGKRNAERHGGDTEYWRKLYKKWTVEEWAQQWAVALADGEPRTFNHLCVELLDTTADVMAGGPAEEGIWLAVEAGNVEYTPDAPIKFRLRQQQIGDT